MSPATQPRRERQAGFTLLEVLVALALLASAMAAIGSLASVGRRASWIEGERAELAQVARRLVNEMTDRAFAGPVTGEADGYTWRIEAKMIGPVPVPTAPAEPSASAPSAQFPFGRPGQPQQVAWVPFRIVLRVTGPGGAIAEIVTVRLGKVAL